MLHLQPEKCARPSLETIKRCIIAAKWLLNLVLKIAAPKEAIGGISWRKAE